MEKAKIVDRGSLSSTPERTGSELQYEPFLCSVACSKTELSIRESCGRSGKDRSPKKLKSLIEVHYVAHLKLQVLSFNMNLHFSP